TLLFILSVISFSCNSQDNSKSEGLPVSIHGTVKSDVPKIVYLEKMNDRNIPTRIDSAALGAERTFDLKFRIPEPGIYQVNIDSQQIIGLILDGGETITLTADG